MTDFKAFTLKNEKGLLNMLKTYCGVSKPFNPKVENSIPKMHQFLGLWDTGASGSVISKAVIDRLNLKPISVAKVYHANGESFANVFAINLILPNQVGFHFVKVTEGILAGFDLIIGMDIITTGDFSITNFDSKTTFSFRVPSLKEVDFVKESNT